MHMDSTLELLEHATVDIGRYFRAFANKVSAKYTTYETPKEHEKRLRATAQRTSSFGNTSEALQSSSTRKTRSFNLKRVKFHYIGEYPSDIRSFGTTDSFTTRLVS